MSSDPTTDGASLTVKQQRFVEEYAVDSNATQAAVRAGYARNSAGVTGCRLLKNANVSAAIRARLDTLSMTADEALKRLTDIARASLAPFIKVGDDGRVWYNLADEEARKHLHLVRKFRSKRRVQNDGTLVVEWVEIELHDAKDAIDKILRARGAYHSRLEAGGPRDAPIPLQWRDE